MRALLSDTLYENRLIGGYDEPTDPGSPEGSYLVIAGRIPELDAAVAAGDREKAIIDALEATGVELERLSPPNAWVRAHFTFTPGAETITAEAVKRLAEYNAVLWIDVLGG